MRLKPQQTGYVATKIGIDLANAPFITMPKGREAVVEAAKKIIDENLEKEHALDEKVKKINPRRKNTNQYTFRTLYQSFSNC